MKKILRPFYLLYQLIAYPLAGIASALTGICISLFGKYIPIKGGDYWPAVIWSKFMIRIFLLPMTVVGREKLDPNKNYIFIANHQGSWDIFMMFGYIGRNFKWMMKDSLRKMPFIGQACYDTGHIFVNRDAPQKEIFVKAVKTIKKGAFVIADMTQVEVVPIAIQGSYDLLPKKGIFMNWSPLKLTILDPIKPIGKGKENVEYLMTESRAAIAKALGEE